MTHAEETKFFLNHLERVLPCSLDAELILAGT